MGSPDVVILLPTQEGKTTGHASYASEPGEGLRPVARVFDAHDCPMVGSTSKPHGDGRIRGLGGLGVFIGWRPVAVAGDGCGICPDGPVNFITTGSSSVWVNGKPVARKGDWTRHGGKITEGAPNVFIGGGTVGHITGDPFGAEKLCREQRGTKGTSSRGQTRSNCGVEDSRMIIEQATGRRMSEEELLKYAQDKGYASRSKDRERDGLTDSWGLRHLLEDQGVPTDSERSTKRDTDEVERSVRDNRGVIAGIDDGDSDKQNGHAVMVTGVQYNPDTGQPETVYVNDTADTEGCAKMIPYDEFKSRLLPDHTLTVTRDPIYPGAAGAAKPK